MAKPQAVNYEKIAEAVDVGKDDPPAPPPRQYLPLDHEKYQGIATAKGYKQGEDFSGHRLVRVHYSHEAMIDIIIAEPTITQNELARRFGKSIGWISIVMGSDAFQAALAKRRDDILDPELVATIEERLRGLAAQSLQVISKRLEQSESSDLALKSLDIASKALGFGARQSGGGNTTNNFVIALPVKAKDSDEWLKSANPRQIEDQSGK